MCSATSGTTSLACLPMETATDLVSSRLTRLTRELRTCPRLLVEGCAEPRALLARVFRPDDVEVVGAAVDGDDLLVAQDEAHRVEAVVGALLVLVVHPDAHAPAELLAAHRRAALVELLRLVGRLLEGVGELEAEGGERLRIGLFLVGDDGRAVDPRGEAHEDALGELDVRILRGRGGRFGGGGGGGGAHGRGPTAQSPRGTWISPRPAR